MGSDMASQILDILNIAPMTAGAISKTSVENFITYNATRRYMYPAPIPGNPYAIVVPKETLGNIFDKSKFYIPSFKQNSFTSTANKSCLLALCIFSPNYYSVRLYIRFFYSNLMHSQVRILIQ